MVAGETATTTGSVIPAQRNRATTKMNKMRSSRERDPGSRDGHVMRRLRAARPPARPLATRSPGIIVRRTAAKFDSQRPAKFCRLFSRSRVIITASRYINSSESTHRRCVTPYCVLLGSSGGA